MAEHIANRWLRPRVVLPTLITLIVVTAILSPVGEDVTGRTLSTRSRAINGSHGLRQILDRLGWNTAERIVPFSGTLDSNATYVILNTPIDPSGTEIHALLEAVRRGANAIVVPGRGTALADSIGVQQSTLTYISLRPSNDTLLGDSDPVDTLREQFGVASARTFHTYLEGTPASDSDTVGVWPPNATTLLYVHAKHEHSEIAVLPMQRGAVVAIGDPTFLRNDVLRKTAGAVLAVRVLESVDPARRTRIVFDEYHQGFGEESSEMDVLEEALFETTWGRAAVQIAVAGLLYLLVIGVRPIAPVSRARYERRSPLEHVGALSRAYEAIGATGLAAQRLVRGIRRRHPFGTTGQLTDDGYLALLRLRLPALGGDIDILSNALANKPTPEQLVSAGAAIDHIERNLIK
ncbi:MAG TPA: DUF4350 domain-containing protein [Gemmatimonadaceae bacterium]|nr:DUF4350 domain-containing protein [Gemmatimonadaceae bacterium]